MPGEHLSLLSVEDALDTTCISAENKKCNEVMEEFDKYFKVHKIMIYECATFNERN